VNSSLLLAYRQLLPVTVLGVAAAEIYRVPFPLNTVGRTYIRGIQVCNTHVAAVTWSLYVVPSGGAASAGNRVVAGSNLDVGGFIHEAYLDGEFTLGGDTSLWALASVASVVTIYLAGMELAP
jgi:hypothetical protein